MDQFIQVFGRHLQMTYGCFDRMVINAYLPSLIRECNLVYLLRDIDGVDKITQEVLRGRTRRTIRSGSKAMRWRMRFRCSGLRKACANKMQCSSIVERASHGRRRDLITFSGAWSRVGHIGSQVAEGMEVALYGSAAASLITISI